MFASLIPFPCATSLNLTVSPVVLPCFSSNTETVVDDAVEVNAFEFNNLGVVGSTLAGLAFNKPSASAVCGLGFNCGCLDSYSEK